MDYKSYKVYPHYLESLDVCTVSFEKWHIYIPNELVGVVPKWRKPDASKRSGCRDFKSNSYYLDGNPFSIAFSCGYYSIKVFNPNDAL
jgi:hypothetical protein